MHNVVDLISDDEDENEIVHELSDSSEESEEEAEAKVTASQFYQLRDHLNDPARPWALSIHEMLEPAETVTHVLLSTFGHASEQLAEFRQLLERCCPRLEDVCLISDWRSTDGVGATKQGPVGKSMGYVNNPYAVALTPGDGFRVRCTVVYPPLSGDEPTRAAAKGRGKHSIQHTKILLVRHATVRTGGREPTSGLMAAHLRVHILSCNMDNVLSQKGQTGDVIWRSPPLPALGETRPELVLPSTAPGWRFGAPLFKMLRGRAWARAKLPRGRTDAWRECPAGSDGRTARVRSHVVQR